MVIKIRDVVGSNEVTAGPIDVVLCDAVKLHGKPAMGVKFKDHGR